MNREQRLQCFQALDLIKAFIVLQETSTVEDLARQIADEVKDEDSLAVYMVLLKLSEYVTLHLFTEKQLAGIVKVCRECFYDGAVDALSRDKKCSE